MFKICPLKVYYMRCPNCNFDNPDKAKFCNECGTRLNIKCPNCGTENAPNSKFCSECGTNLLQNTQQTSPSTTQPSKQLIVHEEVRNLTVLFCDVSGFTAMSEKLSAGEVEEIMHDILNRLTKAVEEQKGTIIKYTGDGFMACFGLLEGSEFTSKEYIPIQGAKSALSMQSILKNFSEELTKKKGFSLKMRIGLNSGETAITKMGNKLDLYGDTVNTASRMEHHAPVNGILMTYNTYQYLYGLFNINVLDPIYVKGKTEPIPVYELLSEKTGELKIGIRELHGLPTKMFGRENELAKLKSIYEKVVEEKKCSFVNIIASAGLGKSRIEYEFSKYIENLPYKVTYLKGNALSYISKPYYVYYTMMTSVIRLSDDKSTNISHSDFLLSIANALQLTTDKAEEYAHFIGYLIGLPFKNSKFINNIISDPQQIEMRAYQSFLKYFSAIAEKNPLVIVIEDIHWADDGTIKLTDFLFKELKNLPVMIITTIRPEQQKNVELIMQESENKIEIILDPLSEKVSKKHIEYLLSNVKNKNNELEDFILLRAQGNPLFTEELIRFLFDKKALIKTDKENKWIFHPERLNLKEIPLLVEDVVQARLDILEKDEREFIRKSAVIGTNFWKNAVKYVEESEGKLITDNRVEEILKTSEYLEIIFPNDDSAFIDENEYAFTSALLRDVAYKNILTKYKRRYHKSVGEWFESKGEKAIKLFTEDIANHFFIAEVYHKALKYYVDAGNEYRLNFRNSKAIQMYNNAIELLEKGLVEDTSLISNGKFLISNVQLFDYQTIKLSNYFNCIIRYYLDMIYELTGQRTEQKTNLDRALEICEKMITENITFNSQPAKNIQSSFFNLQSLKADILTRLARFYDGTGKLSEGLDCSQLCLSICKDIEYKKGEGEILNVIGNIYSDMGEPQKALPYYEQSLSIRKELKDRRGEAISLNNIGSIYQLLVQLNEALSYYEQSLFIAREILDKKLEAGILSNMGLVYNVFGEIKKSLSCFQESLSIRKNIGDKQGEGIILRNMGVVHSDFGELEKAILYYELSLSIKRETKDRWGEGSNLYSIGTAYYNMGELNKSIHYYKDSLSIMKEFGDKWSEGLILYEMGKVYVSAFETKYQLAIEHFLKAEEIFLQIEDKNFLVEVYSYLALAHIYIRNINKAMEYLYKSEAIYKDIESSIDVPTYTLYWNKYLVLKKCMELDVKNQNINEMKDALDKAYKTIIEEAKKINDEEIKTKFLNMKTNREVINEWETLCGSTSI